MPEPVPAVRGKSPVAFHQRCVPADRVACGSNTPDIPPPRALSGGRLANLGAARNQDDRNDIDRDGGRPAGPGATRDPCRGLLVIACGALAREIDALRRRWGWRHLHLKCLPAELHNRPEAIPERLRRMIRRHRADYGGIFIAYADCGTTGGIDRVLEEEGAERLEGAHCYEFFAGRDRFTKLSMAEPGTFYLTDFLARHFDRLVIKPLGLDRHPELRDAYFGHYRRLVYLSQRQDERLLDSAARAAARLGLDFEHVRCGYGGLETGLAARFGIGAPENG